jgi:glycerate-2-kinase
MEHFGRLSLPDEARKIFAAALREVRADRLVRQSVHRQGAKLNVRGRVYDLDSYERVFLIAIGKAAPFMAGSLVKVLDSRLTEGIALCGPGQRMAADRIVCLPAAHPLPDERSVRAAKRIFALAQKAGPKDLVFVLISGGASAQVCLPRPPANLAAKRWVTDALLQAGADIIELNTVRKHLSQIKGGRLAAAAYPAAVVNLVVSDVVGNDLESIASGPSYWDSTSYGEARRILEDYSLWVKAPASVRKVIEAGVSGRIPETLKKGDLVFRNVSTFIIGDNATALAAAAERAEGLGFRVFILTGGDSGEARDAAGKYASVADGMVRPGKPGRNPLCLLAGGELTVKVKGKGRGGRNAEFVLAGLLEFMRIPAFGSTKDSPPRWNFLVASLGTDGRDGPTDAAGAWANAATSLLAKRRGLSAKEYLERNDSYSFFKKAGGLIITGPTRTNVMDLRLILLAPTRKAGLQLRAQPHSR